MPESWAFNLRKKHEEEIMADAKPFSDEQITILQKEFDGYDHVSGFRFTRAAYGRFLATIDRLKKDRNDLEGLIHVNERLNLKILAMAKALGWLAGLRRFDAGPTRNTMAAKVRQISREALQGVNLKLDHYIEHQEFQSHQLKATIKRLREKLKKAMQYVNHKSDCQKGATTDHCTCGVMEFIPEMIE